MTNTQSAAVDIGPAAAPLPGRSRPLVPTPDLSPVERLVDTSGLISGDSYRLDDNGRALVLACRAPASSAARALRLAQLCLGFIENAWSPAAERFRGAMARDGGWLDAAAGEDSQGRALWALGVAAAEAPDRALRQRAADLFDQTAPIARGFGCPRAIAYALLGGAAMMSRRGTDQALRRAVTQGAELLHLLLVRDRRPDWAWFEAVAAQDKARLAEALIRVGALLNRDDLTATGLDTLEWMLSRRTPSACTLRPLPTDLAGLSQAQALEALAMVEACAAAYQLNGETAWLAEARRAYDALSERGAAGDWPVARQLAAASLAAMSEPAGMTQPTPATQRSGEPRPARPRLSIRT